jgi:hypothetical protein
MCITGVIVAHQWDQMSSCWNTLHNSGKRGHCWNTCVTVTLDHSATMTYGATIPLDHISATVIHVMRCEEHL